MGDDDTKFVSMTDLNDRELRLAKAQEIISQIPRRTWKPRLFVAGKFFPGEPLTQDIFEDLRRVRPQAPKLTSSALLDASGNPFVKIDGLR